LRNLAAFLASIHAKLLRNTFRAPKSFPVMLFCITIGMWTILLGIAMAKLTVTARGQVTFKKEVLQHLGIRPGQKIELELLPEGRGLLRAVRPTGTIDDFLGLLAGKTTKVASIEEINEAGKRAWAGKK
jgi:bifunctional DNA-binding transcriptional regulator/antitoxin component of YhaV-PrlF toxin-antitoxin module